jgi:hypothetical protein
VWYLVEIKNIYHKKTQKNKQFKRLEQNNISMENPVWCFKLMNAASSRNTCSCVIFFLPSRRHTCSCVMLCGFSFHSSRSSWTIYLLTGDWETKLTNLTLKKNTFSIILRIITLSFPIYIIHGNLDINGNKTYIVFFIGFRWSSTTSLLCLFGKESLYLNRH